MEGRNSRKGSKAGLLAAAVAGFLIFGCSTTRVLSDGEYRLAKNDVKILNSKTFNPKEVESYIKQQPKGFNPFLYVYNWSGKDTTKTFNRFIRKMGVAPVVYQSDLVEISVNNIKNHLQYIGYYDSEVESSVEVKNKNVKVHYDVTLGKQFPISRITYVVPKGGEFEDDFMADTVNITVKPGDFLSEASLEAESERSASAMRQKGYYGFNRNYYFFEADTLAVADEAALEMRINEYTRSDSPSNAKTISKYRIGDVSITYPKTIRFRQSVLKGMNTITPGDIYDETVINNTYSRLSALKAFNSVNIELNERDSSTVDCAISLTPSKLQGYKVSLEASSNSSGLIGISPQVTYSHKNIFGGGEWLNLSFLGNFQYRFSDAARSNEYGMSAGLSLPKFLGLPYSRFKNSTVPRTEFNLSFNHQDRPEYTRNVGSLSYGYSGNKWGKFFYQYYPVQANVVGLKNMDEKFYENLSRNPLLRYAYQDHFDLGSGLTLYYTTNADVIPKDSYHFYRLSVDVSGNVMNLLNPLLPTNKDGRHRILGLPYTQYVRGEFSLGKTFRFGKNDGQAIATRFLAGAGYAYGNSSALPFEKQFYSGGANSLRGWQARSVGPGNSPKNTTFSIPSQTGDMKLEANLEYRFKMFWKLEGAAFADAGNVWTLMDRDANSDKTNRSNFDIRNFHETIAADWGLGVRLDMTFILLRFDFGFKLYDPSREASKWIGLDQFLAKDTFAFHFGVGYPF